MFTEKISIPIEGGMINSTLHKPREANTIVLISYPPGIGRFNQRNRTLIEQLDQAGLATLLCDWSQIKMVLEKQGDFNHLKMAQNLASIVRWLKSQRAFKDFSTALYGSGTGAAFSVIAASEMEDSVKAVVSRNGRLELAEDYLAKVKSPTFIAVGEKDYRLFELNKYAYKKLECPKQFVMMPGITPFFEVPKKMERIGRLSIDWIKKNSLPETDPSNQKKMLLHS